MKTIERILILFCTTILECFITVAGIAEIIYAGENNYRFVSPRICPTYELKSLMSDEIQIKASKALRSWFISEYAYQDDWYNKLWDHTVIILMEPFIIKTEYLDESVCMVYCSSGISSYALFVDEDGQQYFSQGYDTTGLFSISFDVEEQSNWRVTSVRRIEDNDEELYPGSGIGTDGFPGLSDYLAQHIPDWGFDTFDIAKKYLDFYQIDAEILTW